MYGNVAQLLYAWPYHSLLLGMQALGFHQVPSKVYMEMLGNSVG